VPDVATDAPVLASLIVDLGAARDRALNRVGELEHTLADLEALHEPDANGDCPTCRAPAPCVTHLLLRAEITGEDAIAAVRDGQPIDLIAAEGITTPAVPSLASLLAVPTPGLDRFFDALLSERATEGESGQQIA
jgi:hypothetical protein